jgi:hypothetical protein
MEKKKGKSTGFSKLEKFVLSLASFTPGLGIVSDALLSSVAESLANEVFAKLIREKVLGADEQDIRDRAKVAAARIDEASTIISDIQTELSARSSELDKLMGLIEERQNEAMHWGNLASVNEEMASAFTKELEKGVREQLRAELNKGKRRRQVVSLIWWIFTLLIGAIVGAIVQQLWQTGSIFPIQTPTPFP